MEVFGGTYGVIWTIVIGFLVGLVAKFLKPGKDPGGFIITTLIGIAGSLARPLSARRWAGTSPAPALASSCR